MELLSSTCNDSNYPRYITIADRNKMQLFFSDFPKWLNTVKVKSYSL